MDIETLLQRRMDRRKLLRNGSLMGAGAAALGGLGFSGFAKAQEMAMGVELSPELDAKILTFALNLEYLEAEYYLRGAYGLGLASEDVGMSPGEVTGGRKVEFATPATELYVQEVAADEEAHVQFLRAALGESAVSRPAIDFTGAFTGAARAAGIIGDDQEFDPFANELFFLHGAFLFEDVGVSAYGGAAPFISNRETVLAAAVGIGLVEAYHAGEVRTLLYQNKDVMAVGEQTVAEVVQKISDARDLLSGEGDDDQGIVQDGLANIVNANSNAIAFSRTPKQVLDIVYLDLGLSATPGGFFPNGLNGDFSGVPSL